MEEKTRKKSSKQLEFESPNKIEEKNSIGCVTKRYPGILDHSWLVVWNMNFIFPYIRNFIIPTDSLIFFRGVGIPPTRYNTIYII